MTQRERFPAGQTRAAPRPGPSGQGVPMDIAAEVARLDRLAVLLDSRFRVPGLGWRFGLDGIVGLVPVVGDTLSLAPAAYILWQARRLGVSNHTLGRMTVNAGIDYAVGLVPFAGDLFDTVFKSNLRNIELVKRDLLSRHPAR